MIQTVAAPSAPVQRGDRGASQPRRHAPPGDLLVFSHRDLEPSGNTAHSASTVALFKKVNGCLLCKHKTLLRRKDLELNLLELEFLAMQLTCVTSGYVSFLSLIFPIGEIGIITVLVS